MPTFFSSLPFFINRFSSSFRPSITLLCTDHYHSVPQTHQQPYRVLQNINKQAREHLSHLFFCHTSPLVSLPAHFQTLNNQRRNVQAEKIEMCIYIHTVCDRYCAAHLNTENHKYVQNVLSYTLLLSAVHFQWQTVRPDSNFQISWNRRLPLSLTGTRALIQTAEVRIQTPLALQLKGTGGSGRGVVLLSLYEMIIYTFGVSVHSFNSASRLCASYETRQAGKQQLVLRVVMWM